MSRRDAIWLGVTSVCSLDGVKVPQFTDMLVPGTNERWSVVLVSGLSDLFGCVPKTIDQN